MRMVLMVLMVVLAAGCGAVDVEVSPAALIACGPENPCDGGGCSADDYRCLLNGLATVDLAHGPDAIAIAASFFGIACPTVRWVVDPLPQAPSGDFVDGVDINCSIWIEWWGRQWTSGASADGPSISFTSFPHEMAHCALDRAGTPDPHHTRVDVWGSGGKVSALMNLLVAAGL